jgi:ribosomal protein L11 methyltransferase
MNYTEVRWTVNPLIPFREILTVYLADAGFDSFVDFEEGVLAYIPSELLVEESLLQLAQTMKEMEAECTFTHQEIEQQNWNAEWESQFSPIDVSEECRVRAPFHEATPVKYDLIIEPKMSFGTGHHATTFLMLDQMLKMDFIGKAVLDMGSGTGVLAFLAEKMGAERIDAIDIDDWAFENCIENAERNGCHKTQVIKGGAEQIQKQYDVIIANINRNILVQDGAIYTEHLLSKGTLLLSGFYEEDQAILKEAFSSLHFVQSQLKDGWCMMEFCKNEN